MSVHTDKRYAYVRHLTRHADTIAAHGYQEKVRESHHASTASMPAPSPPTSLDPPPPPATL
eukprot:scaffold60273_cov61-Phaeocystis_antarctica.AAC.1